MLNQSQLAPNNITGQNKLAPANAAHLSSEESSAWFSIVLAALFFSLATVSKELQFVLAVIAIPSVAAKINRRAFFNPLLWAFWPWFLFTLLGLYVSIFQGVFDFDTLKGFWYESRVPVYVIFGALLALQKQSVIWIMKVVILAGIFLAFKFLIAYYTDPNVAAMGGADRFYVRSQIGTGALVVPLALVVSISWLFLDKKLSSQARAALLASCVLFLLSMSLADSRTSFITVAILFIFTLRLFPLKGFARCTVPFILIILVVLTTPVLKLFVSTESIERFASSQPDSINELIALNRTTDYEVQNYWRGYETYLAFSHITNYGIGATLVGAGLHDVVSVPAEVIFNSEMPESLPIFHNGFSFFFVRGGIVGVILLMVQCSIFASRSVSLANSLDMFQRFFGLFACGLMMASILQFPTVAGFLNYGEGGSTSCILLGYAMGLQILSIAVSKQRGYRRLGRNFDARNLEKGLPQLNR